MNKYIPNEVKNLAESKQRVMRNVLNTIENNSRRPKRKWQYGLITAILAMSAMFFLLNEVFNDDNHQSATKPPLDVTELPLDLTKPTFFTAQGLLYLQGVTLGDSQTRVIERLGEKYTIDNQEDGSVADVILIYDGNARFYFHENKLITILLMNVDENYFDTLFNDYEGVKVNSSTDDDRFIYSKETSQIVKATFVPDGNLYLYLLHAGPDLLENADFLKMEQESD